MDFSKIKKIFYIVAIISMLLSIKSKVFASSTVTYEVNNSTETLDLTPLQDYKYYFVCTYNPNTNLFYFQLITTLNGFTYYPEGAPFKNFHFVNTDGNKNYSNAGSFSSLSDIQNIINNATPRYTSETYISYRTDYATGNNAINLELAQYSCNFNIINENTNEIAFEDTINVFRYPFFDNITEIENGNPEGVFISSGDYSSNDYLYFHLLEIQTGISNQDNSRYYYIDKTFALNKDSNFFRTWVDPNIDGYYYYIPRYKLGLSQNSSYLYVLTNSKNQIQNSNGIIEIDKPNGVYDVVQSDTSGVITATEEETDRMKNIESTITQNQETVNNINNSLTNTNITTETETDIDTNLNFSNSAPQFSSLFNGFFSRLTTIISDLGNYQDTDVITVNLPIPFTNNTIPISSDFIFSNQNNNFLKNIATLLWYFIFGRYFLYFLINTYWLITNGQFFKFYLTQKEAITSDML